MPRQKKPQKPVREIAFYVIEVNDWQHSYSLSLNDNDSLKDLFGPGLFREHKSFALSGVFLEPKKITGKDLKIKLFGSRDMAEILNKPEDYPRASAKAVGGLTVRGKTREYYGSLPMGHLYSDCQHAGCRKSQVYDHVWRRALSRESRHPFS
jgi:hypothetical protein